MNQKIIFYKYQATGNDFIIIDDRDEIFPKENIGFIKQLCNRKFGIGADGLILLQKSSTYDFKMWYANSDGNQSSMCGNGGRSIAAFAKKIGVTNSNSIFEAIDGVHEASINDTQIVELKMCNVTEIIQVNNAVFEVNTGSPHLIWFVNEVANYPVFETGKNIQSMPEYKSKGINVNFIQEKNSNSNNLQIRTYERGVEDETLSCGTGATAASICYLNKINATDGQHLITLETQGGQLQIKCEKTNQNNYKNIWLCGAANFVFEGIIEL
jgi:diaminopimelate epimerase